MPHATHTTHVQMRERKRQLASLQQVVSHSEHRVKAREAELTKLKHKLAAQAKAHRASRAKARATFERIHQRGYRPSSTSDAKALAIIDMYETERGTMARENKFLTQEVARLNAELRQKDNRLAQLDAQGSGAGGVGGSNHTGGAEYSSLGSATALRIERVHRKQLERAAMLRAKEKELRAKALTIRKELVTVTSYCKELEDHVENLQLEVQVRACAVVRGRLVSAGTSRIAC